MAHGRNGHGVFRELPDAHRGAADRGDGSHRARRGDHDSDHSPGDEPGAHTRSDGDGTPGPRHECPTPDPGAPPPPPPPPSGGSCSLGGGDPNHRCSRTTHTFLHDVDAAIDRVVDSRPGLFDLGDDVCGGCYRIKDHDAYVAALARELERMGYCALYDGEEMGVKNTNTFNDQYDISTSTGYIRRGDKSYRSTCRPAWF